MSQPYSKEITRKDPGCVVFLLDQSGSMEEGIAGSNRPKAEALAATVNRFIGDLTIECIKGEAAPRHYFDVAVIGYRTDPQGHTIVRPAFQAGLQGQDIASVVELYDNPLREIVQEVDDGFGGLVANRHYIWYEAVAEGGSPMGAGFDFCTQIVNLWISLHPDSFPPIVIHITDGESTDEPELAAETLRSLATSDGNVLLFNCHLSMARIPGVMFPSREEELPDEYSRLLFRMSSLLPDPCVQVARGKGFHIAQGARGMVLNADSTALIQMVQIGTVVKQRLR